MTHHPLLNVYYPFQIGIQTDALMSLSNLELIDTEEIEEYAESKLDIWLQYDPEMYKEFNATIYLSYRAIDEEYDEPRVLISNLTRHALFISVLLLMLFILIIGLFSYKLKRV